MRWGSTKLTRCSRKGKIYLKIVDSLLHQVLTPIRYEAYGQDVYLLKLLEDSRRLTVLQLTFPPFCDFVSLKSL